jgi:hypothetical protein
MFPSRVLEGIHGILGAIFSVTFWQYTEAKGALIEKQKRERQ